MYCNTSCTLYNAFVSGEKTQYQKTVLDLVLWDDGGTHTQEKPGRTISMADTGRIFVPFSVFAGGKTYRKPKEWEALPDKSKSFTIKPGDYAVKGLCAYEWAPDQPIQTLLRGYDNVVTIKSVANRDFGNQSMQHWEIEVV